MAKCSNGHKPPVRGQWKVMGALVCTDCLRRAQNVGIPTAVRINVNRELRRTKQDRKLGTAEPA